MVYFERDAHTSGLESSKGHEICCSIPSNLVKALEFVCDFGDCGCNYCLQTVSCISKEDWSLHTRSIATRKMLRARATTMKNIFSPDGYSSTTEMPRLPSTSGDSFSDLRAPVSDSTLPSNLVGWVAGLFDAAFSDPLGPSDPMDSLDMTSLKFVGIVRLPSEEYGVSDEV
jgi:hypothetical protein